jgi:uridine kinase
LRVAVDGRTSAGKTTFAHELAAALRGLGRPTARASLDDFKHSWSHAREYGYDRESGEGYYRNAYDFASAARLPLRPAESSGSGRVVLCAHDPLTGADHRDTVEHFPGHRADCGLGVCLPSAVCDVLGLPHLALEIDPDLALRRGVTRDSTRESVDEAVRLHQDRAGVAEEIYLNEVDPLSLADVIVDNTKIDTPRIAGRSASVPTARNSRS